MPDDKAPDDHEDIDFLEQLRDRPIAVGSIGALAAHARNGDFDEVIRDPKTTPGLDAATAQTQVESPAQQTEPELTESIEEAKSGLRRKPRSIADAQASQNEIAELGPGIFPRSTATELRSSLHEHMGNGVRAFKERAASSSTPSSSPGERKAVVAVCGILFTTCVGVYGLAVQVGPRDSDGGASFWPFPWLYVVAEFAVLAAVVALLSWTGRDRPQTRPPRRGPWMKTESLD